MQIRNISIRRWQRQGRFKKVKLFLLHQKIELQALCDTGVENRNFSFISATSDLCLDTEEEQRLAFPSTNQAQQLSRGKRMCKSLNSLLARKHRSSWWSLRIWVEGSEIFYFQSWAHSSILQMGNVGILMDPVQKSHGAPCGFCWAEKIKHKILAALG